MALTVPRVLALTPAGLPHPGVVVAAGRAGGLGILDFALVDDRAAALAAAQHAARLSTRPFGLRLRAEGLAAWVEADWPASLKLVVLTEPPGGDWGEPVRLARERGWAVLAEATRREAAGAAEAAGVDGLILAGLEAGGWGGEESSFVLLQAVLQERSRSVPVWVRGGVGLRVASACVAAGARGVVLDGALLLARESPLDGPIRERIQRWDGSETIGLGRATRRPLRVYAPPASPALAHLRAAEGQGPEAWEAAVRVHLGWQPHQAWPAGQEAALAAALARRFGTVGGIVQAFQQAMAEGPALAGRLNVLAEGSPFAVAHGLRYPIVQGPMTRVSDSVAFAEAVAAGGALPFLALALMSGPDARVLLEDAARRLAGRAWGVGILGFVPPELRLEQITAIRAARPPFALIAGGRPDQARELERDGIRTYLHVPSPGLLRQYLAQEGARRFVLEGRECGGHVGPRSSFVLWEQAVEVVSEALDRGAVASEVDLLLAGGIHDACSAAMAAAAAAPLAERGVRIGVLMGTAYLFTAEAVATGAIVPGFQAEALACSRTVLLQTGPGHEVRVSPTPFATQFEAERQRLLREGRPADEVRALLEHLNVGRLRVATKGVDRVNGRGSPLGAVRPAEQKQQGLYMVGQVAALRSGVTTIAQLHHEVSAGSAAWIAKHACAEAAADPGPAPAQPCDIAIVGMAGLFPGASDVRAFWQNTLRGLDAITEIPADRWDWRLYYDPDPKAPDKITSRWGGFLPEVPFDPLHYGMPPASVPSIEPMQLLTLEAVRAALEDAGYRERPFPRERTAVVLGAGGGAAQLAMGYAFRSYLPLLDTVLPGAGRQALATAGGVLPEWTEDSFPGMLLNVAAGRVANRFDLGGANYTVDAACGSSLAAAAVAVRELESGAADMVILGGIDTVQNPFTYLAFSKTHAFSPRGRCRPFDASADGIVISEGVGVLVLKRLADAERDGDRIYAVIKGLGSSSDGRAKGLTAPRAEGQVKALERAYAKAGVSPETVGYVEAHGTGTAAGDLAEVGALAAVLKRAGAPPRSCAVGSVKSSIGHTKCAAGLAGLINAALALHHKVLPPTIGVQTPNPRVDWESVPVHISAAPRPWLRARPERPRRAGVSAFGFGGTNFHAVLEEYDGDPVAPEAALRDWPAELLVWRCADRARLLAQVARLEQALEGGARPALRDLAHTLAAGLEPGSGPTLAIVAADLADLQAKLARARQAIEAGKAELHDPRGVYFAERPEWTGARPAVVFPGQGSQYPGMLADLAVAFPEVREAYEEADRALLARGRRPVSPFVFPPVAFDDAQRTAQQAALAAPDVAQPAVGAACLGLLRLLQTMGVEPDVVAGHSYGELVALHAAGVFSADVLAELSEGRGRLLLAAAGSEPGAMAAVAAGPAQVQALLTGLHDVWPVNWNGPSQTVISGTRDSVEQAAQRARELGIRAQVLPTACAFHSPFVARAREPLAELVRRLGPGAPTRPVYANATAAPYPPGATDVAGLLGDHVAQPVRFAEMIEAMHADGARVFVEAGPGGIVSALIGSILAGKPHLAVACDHPGRPGLPTLLHTLARLIVGGLPLRLGRLTQGRSTRRLDLTRLETEAAAPAHSPTTWLVNGARARPAHGPAPPFFGSGPVLPGPTPMTAAHRPAERPAPPAPTLALLAQPPSLPPLSAGGSERVLAAFQRTMQTFLQVQESTMRAYLASRAAAPGTPDGPPFQVDHGPSANGDGTAPAAAHEAPQPGPHASLNGHVSLGEATHAGNGKHDDASLRVDCDAVASRLLQIVQERTGYPAETLQLELDLEADLGIDSIKRVEILGSLREALPGLVQALGSDTEAMDTLSRARTLGAMVERLGRTLPANGEPAAAHEGRNGAVKETPPPAPVIEGISAVRRFLVEAVEAPLPPGSASLAPGGLLVITDDERGIARAVGADLRALGHPVVLVRHGAAAVQANAESANLASPAAVEALVDRLRARGPIAGIVHLLPLRERPAAGLDREVWSARVATDVRGLFLLARAAADDLARCSAHGGACLIAATGLGGSFGSAGDLPDECFPGHGGIAGLLKTLALEWPAVRTRVVDLDPRGEAEVLAADLVHEVLTHDPRAEVGYDRGRRTLLRHTPAPLPDAGGRRPTFSVSPGEAILVSGGARGITAAVLGELARRWRPTLLVLGTTPQPAEQEDAETAALRTPAELKAALHARLRRHGASAGPADLERAFQALRREREIRENLRRFAQAGARVEYAQADVRDADGLRKVVAAWRERFGPPIGLIHGAGVIQDKLLCDKTAESFDRVLATKLDGALNLVGLVQPERLRFAAFFSSVAGRFGNRGQGDYAAANEALNKLALWLDRRWPCRVVSMIWGPWSGVGMVSDLESHLGRRGLGLIPPGVGPARFVDELELGPKGDVEVIVSGDLGPLAAHAPAPPPRAAVIP